MTPEFTHDYPPAVVDGMPVVYRPIDRYPAYLFGDDGSVWSRANRWGMQARWRRLKGCNSPGCYPLHYLQRPDGRRDYVHAHRLILEAHRGPCPAGMEACHGPDPNKLNNRLSNLRWDTRSANIHDAYAQSHGNLKLRESDVHEIRRLRREGWTLQKIADRFGVAKTTIGRICSGKQRTKVPIEPDVAASA